MVIFEGVTFPVEGNEKFKGPEVGNIFRELRVSKECLHALVGHDGEQYKMKSV